MESIREILEIGGTIGVPWSFFVEKNAVDGRNSNPTPSMVSNVSRSLG